MPEAPVAEPAPVPAAPANEDPDMPPRAVLPPADETDPSDAAPVPAEEALPDDATEFDPATLEAEMAPPAPEPAMEPPADQPPVPDVATPPIGRHGGRPSSATEGVPMGHSGGSGSVPTAETGTTPDPPVSDVFESDPFFNPRAASSTPGTPLSTATFSHDTPSAE